MGQVPNTTNHQNSIGLIGRGRAASHFLEYFRLSDISVLQWHRGMSQKSLEDLQASRFIILAVSDSQIESVVNENPWLVTKELVHLSGSLISPFIKSMHPLVSFGSNLFDFEFYQSIPFITEKENSFYIGKYFPNLKNPTYEIPRGAKGKYHALCVSANNFTTLLWQKFFENMLIYGIDLKASQALLESTFINLKGDWKKALTGPLSRGDSQTIQMNLQSLEGDDLKEVYEAFVSNYQRTKGQDIIYTQMDRGEIGL